MLVYCIILCFVAVQTLNRITPRALMYGGRPGDPEYMIVCCYDLCGLSCLDSHVEYFQTTAKYLLHTLPIRLSRRIRQFQELPFLVGCNPHIMRVVRTTLCTGCVVVLILNTLIN